MAQSTLADHVARQQNRGLAKNIIMFLGDGMSIPTLTATRILHGGEQSKMVWEDFPYVGLSKVRMFKKIFIKTFING
jgi:alkaline phosphatase